VSLLVQYQQSIMRINSRLQRRWDNIYGIHTKRVSMDNSVFIRFLKIRSDGEDLKVKDRQFQ